MTQVPTLTMNNGVAIPQLGFGVFKVPPADTERITLAALSVGYRHIDTAEMYGNEAGVGAAVRTGPVARDDIFVTSKLNNGYHRYDDAMRAFDATMAELRFDVLDLFLVHWPMPDVGDYVETWRAMEAMYASGRVRAIGASNFQIHHLERLLDATDVVPAVNQIEVHPYLTQEPLREFNADNGILTEAWSPIARGRILDDPVITAIAGRAGRTSAQVVLRWHIQRGDIVFPKSSHLQRMRENFELFDFALTEQDMVDISSLDQGMRTGPNPDEFHWIP